MNLNVILNCFVDNGTMTVISSFSTCVLGLATLVVSIISVRFLGVQTKINKKLAQLNIAREQPIFIVRTRYEQDADDDKWGTEHLIIKQIGFPNIVPNIQTTVIFKLTNSLMGDKNSISINVGDYFSRTHLDDSEGETIYHTKRDSNHRRYCDLYMEAIHDKNEDGSVLFFDKIILVRIEYTDILNTKQTRFFMNKDEVDELVYQNVLSNVYNEQYRLFDIKYDTIKSLLPTT